MHFVFYSTNDVFRAEELLRECGVTTEIVPTPVQDKAYCGVCVKIHEDARSRASEALQGMDYQQVP